MSEQETPPWHQCSDEPSPSVLLRIEKEVREKVAQEILAVHAWNYANAETDRAFCPDGWCTCEAMAEVARGSK